jgi:hypothetical protein
MRLFSFWHLLCVSPPLHYFSRFSCQSQQNSAHPQNAAPVIPPLFSFSFLVSPRVCGVYAFFNDFSRSRRHLPRRRRAVPLTFSLVTRATLVAALSSPRVFGAPRSPSFDSIFRVPCMIPPLAVRSATRYAQYCSRNIYSVFSSPNSLPFYSNLCAARPAATEILKLTQAAPLDFLCSHHFLDVMVVPRFFIEKIA